MWSNPKGHSLVGEWKFDKVNGFGVQIWANGDRYEGSFKQSIKHGRGI